MPYRQAARLDGEREPEPQGPLVVVDASGRPGAPGGDGASGADGRSSGADGAAGEPAGSARPGHPGGRIEIELASNEPATVVELQGTVTTQGGAVAVRERADFRRVAPIALVAVGGRGGHGGRGGSGGDGARGTSGTDASRHFSGTNGGTGGDGGAAGAGSDGGEGGGGGQVVVRTNERDTHLLMLVQANVIGGAGGAPGEHGAPGRGGSGGRGGSSYSWTDTESYTDSNGQSQTRTTYHSSSGGSDGSSGRDGSSSPVVLHRGRTGADGGFRIEVRGADARVTSYPSRYDLRLVSFAHRNENDDGVYEPGEKVYVRAIEVENVGGMPTPAHHDVVIGLVRGGFVEPEEDESGRARTLTLPRSLAPGQRHLFPREELALTLAPFVPKGPTGPLAAPETLRLHAVLPDVRRSFDAFDAGVGEANGSIVVRFPVELSAITGLSSLGAGQVTRVRVSLRNIASKAIRSLSEPGATDVPGASTDLLRPLGFRVTLGYGELGASEVHYFDEHGERASLEVGFSRSIARLEAGGTFVLEGRLGIAESAAPYTTARLVVACELGPADGASPPRAVQLEELVVRVGRPFAARDGDVLFVVSHRTTAEELGAWEAHALSLGLRSASWDMSLEDGLGILDAIAAGERTFSTVIVLDHPVDTPTGERRPSALLAKRTMLGLARRGIPLLFAGRGPKLSELVVPTARIVEPVALAVTAPAEIRRAAVAALAVGEGAVEQAVETTYAWPWSDVTREGLDRTAAHVSRDLERRFPTRRYVVVPRYEAGNVRKIAWIRRVSVGSLEIRRTTDGASSAMRTWPADEASLHVAETVRDQRLFFALLCTLPFELKLSLLASSTLPFGGDRDPLVLALLGDLVLEQEAWGIDGFGPRSRELDESLPRLRAFVKAFEEAPLAGAEAGVAASRLESLVGWLGFVARGRVRFWEWLPPFLWLRGAQKIRRHVEAGVRRVSRGLPNAEASVKAALSRIRTEHHETDISLSEEALVRTVINAQMKGIDTKTDADVLERGERVVSSESFDGLAKKDEARAERSRATFARNVEARENLLDKASTAALLAAAHASATDRERGRDRVRVEGAMLAGASDLSDLREASLVEGHLR